MWASSQLIRSGLILAKSSSIRFRMSVWHAMNTLCCSYLCWYVVQCSVWTLLSTHRGSLTSSQISHLLLYPSLWLLLSGLSSQFLPLLPIQPAFIVNSGWQYFWEMTTRFCKLREPLHTWNASIIICTCYNIAQQEVKMVKVVTQWAESPNIGEWDRKEWWWT